MWNWEEKNPGTGAWNFPIALRIKGPLRSELWVAAVERVVARHEILRAELRRAGAELVQSFAPPSRFAVEQIDLSSAECAARVKALDAEIRERANTPFALASAPLTRAVLYHVQADQNVFLFLTHHLLFDASSRPLLIGELRRTYEALARGESPDASPDRLQYGDFAAWQSELAKPDGWARDVKYWADALRASKPVSLPYDKPAPAVASRASIKQKFMLPLDLRESLEAAARAEAVTMNAFMAAVLAVVLRHHGVGDDMVVGIVKSTRDLSPQFASMIGYFTNQCGGVRNSS